MKQVIAALAAVTMAFVAEAKWTFDETAKTLSDGNWTLEATKDGNGDFTIKRFKAGGGTLDFAAAGKDGCKVVAIDDGAFRVFKTVATPTVERVIAPDVERIGNLGFYFCDSLKSFEGGEKVTEIGRDAFTNAISFPDGWSSRASRS